MRTPGDTGTPHGVYRRADAERNATNILETATRLLSTDPQVGMATIADAAGVTRVTVNRHFKTRQDLIAAVVEEVVARAYRILETSRTDEGTATEALERLVRGWAVAIFPLPQVVMDQGFVSLPDDVRAQYVERRVGTLLALFERGQASGEFGDLPAPWMSELLGATLRTANAAVNSGLITREQLPDVVMRSLLGGLRG